jgi:hypothetical protein
MREQMKVAPDVLDLTVRVEKSSQRWANVKSVRITLIQLVRIELSVLHHDAEITNMLQSLESVRFVMIIN